MLNLEALIFDGPYLNAAISISGANFFQIENSIRLDKIPTALKSILYLQEWNRALKLG